jgi:hypothetical protein
MCSLPFSFLVTHPNAILKATAAPAGSKSVDEAVAAVPKPRLVLAVEVEVKSERLFAFNNEDDVVTASAADCAAAVAELAAAVAELAAFVAEVAAAVAELAALVACVVAVVAEPLAEVAEPAAVVAELAALVAEVDAAEALEAALEA